MAAHPNPTSRKDDLYDYHSFYKICWTISSFFKKKLVSRNLGQWAEDMLSIVPASPAGGNWSAWLDPDTNPISPGLASVHYEIQGQGEQAASQFPTQRSCTFLNVEYRTPNNENAHAKSIATQLQAA
jgi:hypothetical protein